MGLGPKESPRDMDKITDIQGLKNLKGLLGQALFVDKDLESSRPITQLDKGRLAKGA